MNYAINRFVLCVLSSVLNLDQFVEIYSHMQNTEAELQGSALGGLSLPLEADWTPGAKLGSC